MAGVGEASAIVTLIATAAQLSKAVIDVAGKYKDARKQIETFGHEVATLGTVLDQMYRLLDRDHLERDIEVYAVLVTIVNQCSEFFSELDVYKDMLCNRQGSVRNLTLRGRTKWVFEAAKLEYLRARLESMKTNMLLMMTMQCLHSTDRSETHQATQENARQIQLLAMQSDACVKRLETLENEMTIPTSSQDDTAVDRMSIMTTDTAISARSMRESIMSLYGHQSYYQIILDPREGEFEMAPEMLVDDSRISMIIEDHLYFGQIDQSPDPLRREEKFTDDRQAQVAEAEDSKSNCDNEVAEAGSMGSLWNTVFTHKNYASPTPSEESDASTVITRAHQIAHVPEIMTRSSEYTADMHKPLPSLPSPLSKANDAQVPESDCQYHAEAKYSYVANPEDPNELSFSKFEILELSDISHRWYVGWNEEGERGMIPSNYVSLVDL